MTISVIVAIAQNNVIGANNQLLWHISADLKRFKALTTGHTVIMGRKTYQSIGRPLPNRKNIVISRNASFIAEGCTVCTSLNEAIKLCANETEVFIMGGGEIYRQALPLANKLYLTKVHGSYNGDTFFPEIDTNKWCIILEQQGTPTAEGLEYTFIDLERKK